jgi:hypothetical protein
MELLNTVIQNYCYIVTLPKDWQLCLDNHEVLTTNIQQFDVVSSQVKHHIRQISMPMGINNFNF